MNLQSGGTVGHFMHRYLEVIKPGATIVEAAERMRGQQLGSLLVESTDAEGRMSPGSGIVTETDLVHKVLAKGMDPSLVTVDRIMTSPLLTIDADRPMLDASHAMEANHVRYLCVAEEGAIVGVISVQSAIGRPFR